ncbi:carboxypeptidase regulatory-like domain-containing protein [Silvibacterium sp.]|uniref:TonB-dependent receptor n=1 Tax=Silvibacterium sp. TaxID=1964179 RepID=UPI0039E64FB6
MCQSDCGRLTGHAQCPYQSKQKSASRLKLTFLLFTSLFLPTASVHQLRAQSFTAAITGTVTDQTGGAVNGANVVIRNVDTNESRTLTTDASGLYTANQLLPGNYQITVSMSGYKNFVENGINLVGSQRAEEDVQLQVGSAAQVVQVSSSPIQLDTQTANREVTIESGQLELMPTSFRNPLFAVQSTAGVVSVRTGLNAYMTDQNQNRFSLNGGRDESTSVLVDGASIVAPDLGGAIATPNMDATAEVQVQRTAYDAQFTHTDGGVVSLITKAGSNEFHGSAFEYFRNDHLDANTWSNNHAGVAKGIYQRNQFGGSIGGPVWKDKFFFFGAYEGLRQASADSYSGIMPTDAERTGDYTGTGITLYDPFNLDASGNRKTFESEYGTNAIPASRMDTVGKTVASLFPEPMAQYANNTSYNYYVNSVDPSNYDKFDIRGDYVISPKDTIFARITKAWQYNPAYNYFPTVPGFNNAQGENDFRQEILINNTWTPTPDWVVNAVVSYGKWTEQDTSPSIGYDPTKLGFSSSTVGQWQQKDSWPEFTFNNYAQLGNSAYADTPHETDNLQINISRQLSRHSLKFGFMGEIERLYPNDLYSPTFNFTDSITAGPTPGASGTGTGDSVASLLLGAGSSGTVINQVELDLQQLNWGLYVQDTYRVNDRLTISAGLRYDLQGARTERYNRLNNFDPDLTTTDNGTTLTGGLSFLNSSKRGLWDTNYLNFDPRISFAFKVTDKLVARAGYGIYNPNTYAYSSDAQDSSDGYSSTTTWEATQNGDGVTPANLLANPYPNGLTQPTGSSLGALTDLGDAVNATFRKHHNPYVQDFSLDLQYQLSSAGVLEVGYAGSLGRQLLRGVFENLDQLPSSQLSKGITALTQTVANPYANVITDTTSSLYGSTIPYWRTLVKYPQFSSVNQLPDTPGSSSSFNALSVKYNQRMAYGVSALFTYQWSKAIDNTSENNSWEVSDAVRDVFNPRLDRSISAHDMPQSFAGTLNWDLPFGRGKQWGGDMNRWLDGAIGGWKWSTILRFNDGLPIHLTETSSLTNFNYGVARPNITSEKDLAKHKGSITGGYFNTAAVSYASSGNSLAIGNAPRYIGSVRYAITHDVDTALEKNFAIYKSAIFKFRAEAYNVINTASAFSLPDVNLGDSAFGQTTSTTSVGPRTIQFGARVEF